MAERQPSKLHVAGSNPVSRSIAIAAAADRLRAAISAVVPAGNRLVEDAAALSTAYRSHDSEPPRRPLDARGAAAYAATRMPATFAAAARALEATAARHPRFEPTSILDVGGGTGAVIWAARAVWPSIDAVTVAEPATPMRELGQWLAGRSGDPVLTRATWFDDPIDRLSTSADVVTIGYVLGELAPGKLGPAIDRSWAATRGVIVVVEPGSRAGFGRILAARARLIDAGAQVVAPCPGPHSCPVAAAPATWCHFLARLDRSPLHRRAKSGTRSWEDEPFSYVGLSREAAEPLPRVVLGRPRHQPGRVAVRICVDGRIETRTFSRREGEDWRVARDLDWGDAVPFGLANAPARS